MTPETPGALADALTALRAELDAIPLGLDVPGVEEARRARDELAAQVDDYVLPRLRQMDAPLLMVVGGSTGAGKSTLVNSLVGAVVSEAGVLRPTTRAPVLVCHPEDVRWFEGERVLPALSRTTGGAAPAGSLRLVPTDVLPAGLALLDSPDIDSLVASNRTLARQLLGAADAWLFVTTAARYADAVPWELLHAARERSTALAVVLDRVPPDAVEEVSGHLRSMLAEHGLSRPRLLVVPETELEDGLLPAAALAPVRRWLDALAADAQARAALVRGTLQGALDSLGGRVGGLAAALEAQLAVSSDLQAELDGAYDRALEEVDEALRSGALLRGEVLARWQDVVGTGKVMRALEGRVGWVRDRVRALVTGKPAAAAELESAVETSVDALVQAAGDRAAERVVRAWRERVSGRALLADAPRLDAASAELVGRTRDEVRSWQTSVFELVQREGAAKRTSARLASLGVNGAGFTVMLAVFVHTGGLTGAEAAIAGGTSALGQKVLEAIFGDQAVRALADRARADLLERVGRLLVAERERFEALLRPLAPALDAPGRLRDAAARVERAR